MLGGLCAFLVGAAASLGPAPATPPASLDTVLQALVASGRTGTVRVIVRARPDRTCDLEAAIASVEGTLLSRLDFIQAVTARVQVRRVPCCRATLRWRASRATARTSRGRAALNADDHPPVVTHPGWSAADQAPPRPRRRVTWGLTAPRAHRPGACCPRRRVTPRPIARRTSDSMIWGDKTSTVDGRTTSEATASPRPRAGATPGRRAGATLPPRNRACVCRCSELSQRLTTTLKALAPGAALVAAYGFGSVFAPGGGWQRSRHRAALRRGLAR